MFTEAAMDEIHQYTAGTARMIDKVCTSILHKEGHSCEVEITGRGTYFHAIVGRHCYGNFICIPNHDVGCELSDYSDVFWNRERLSSQLKKVDAVTVACALQHLEEL